MTSRPLTHQEITLCRMFFGDALAYDKVRVHAGKYMPFQPATCSMAPNGHLYMAANYKPDYAAAGPVWRTHFIHEMTHVWQYQNDVLNPVTAAISLGLAYKFNYNAAYAYRLEESKDLIQYNMEQQASIVQDYYSLTQEKDKFHSGRCQNNGNWAELIALYKSVLKNFLADPAYVRKSPSAPKPPSV